MRSPAGAGNRVVLSLVALAVALLLLGDFASVQANRIAPGRGLGLFAALGPAWALAVLGALLALAGLALRPSPARYALLALTDMLAMATAECIGPPAIERMRRIKNLQGLHRNAASNLPLGD